MSSNGSFWDDITSKEMDDWEAQKPIDVYVLINCSDDCDLYIVGARVGEELHRQIEAGDVKGVQTTEEICCFVYHWHGYYEEFDEEHREDEEAYKEAVKTIFGADDVEHGDYWKPRKAYKAILDRERPQAEPMLELGKLCPCVWRTEEEHAAADGTFWISEVRRLQEGHEAVAFGCIDGVSGPQMSTPNPRLTNTGLPSGRVRQLAGRW